MADVEKFGDGRSFVRKLVDPSSIWLMTKAHHAAPGLTPDGLTRIGAGIHLVTTFIQEQAHVANHEFSRKELEVLTFFKALAYGCDKFDGSMADVFEVEEPGIHNRFEGQKLDPRYDRRQEAWAALLRARTAYLKGDFLGEGAAYGAALSCTEPSKERARLETLGFKPPEMGKNLLQGLGTRTMRCVFTEIAGWRNIGGINVQPWVDLGMTAANLYTAHTRRQLYLRYKDSELPPLETERERGQMLQTIEFANARLCDIEQVQREILVTTAATFIGLRISPFQPKVA